ncbi:MAG: Fe-S cluster assembly protein SufD [Cyanobacteria bacterium]|nr:Fe-S cluster assembly protein SufD [Cyanobacteria bacterium CG_2015-16_32_12]NCO78348.1 Fe-S cluster assembly protein SufD [Cyanobacteria bacterium CG_2015-22_32_23]NCQ05325.1 Fe-S cluster assembly protein SufD [Cyanobacteria bacterium CG_2015-09_32_10]NCQ41207.1 Fe-S cluster assembly protein SufD [Cyanobacteria bacterium CG_2015-04_32_10]NCS83765.1 Fe-S cluster assembly protein SufD [Cyanobacteria bacterium CG_2015-02_32_10]
MTMLKSDTYSQDLLQLTENQTLDFNSNLASLVKEIRVKSANNVVKLNIPSDKDEDWRFTDLSDLQKQNWCLANKTDLNSFVLDGFILEEASHSRLVFVNGFYAANLSDISALSDENIYVGNLSNLDEDKIGKISEYLSKNEPKNEVFTALNSAGITDAFVIWVKANTKIVTPIHLLHLTARENFSCFTQPRILVVAEAHSNLNFIEYYGAVASGCSDSVKQNYYLTNAVTEIHLQDNAEIHHTRIQRESGDCFHIAKTTAFQDKNSHYTINEVSLGGKFYRHNLHIQQQGEETQTNLNGLTMLQGKQMGDTHSEVSLTKPHGTINQLHKFIIDDSGRGVFNGKIHVPKLAQLTNATQLNRNLLLSSKARINTKPELQITADNVKCAHGATISQLEADEIFYLRSRGLNEYDARHLLMDAFAAEIIDKIPYESLKHRLTQCVTCRTLE